MPAQFGFATALDETPKALLGDALLALLVTAGFVAVLYLMRRGFRRLYAATDAVRRFSVRSGHWQALRLVPPVKMAEALIGVARLVRVALTAAVAYFYILLALSCFPGTSTFSERLTAYALAPLTAMAGAFLSYLPNLLYIAVIVTITRYLLKFIRVFFDAIGDGTLVFAKFHREWAAPTYDIARVLVLAFTAVELFPFLPGAQSDAFKGVSIFLGILFSLGSSSAVGNVVAGVVLTYTRAFQLGDRVKVGETVGDVIEKTLLVTRLRTIKNVAVTIPNGTVLSSEVHNYSTFAKSHGVIVHTTVTIGYDAPWQKVHDLLIDSARHTTYLTEEPPPFVLQTGLDDFYVTYQINAHTDRADLMAGIESELHRNIQEAFNAAGVDIMSPHYALTKRDEPLMSPRAAG